MRSASTTITSWTSRRAIRDAISLAEPIAPLCRPDCPGLCETCGADLTDDPGHAHADDDIDPRLAPLADLRSHLD